MKTPIAGFLLFSKIHTMGYFDFEFIKMFLVQTK